MAGDGVDRRRGGRGTLWAILGRLLGAAPAAGVEAADVADQLLEEGQFAAARRRGARHRRDGVGVLEALLVDRGDDILLVEVDDENLLVDDVGVEEGDLLGAPADVIPGMVVEDADAGRGPEELANLIGTTREAVSTQMSRFRRMGLIRREGKALLLNVPRLVKLTREEEPPE